MSDVKCPHCGKKWVIKRGKRETKYGKKQLYYCKVCKKKFSETSLEKKVYSPQVIYHSLVYYNLGHTLEETSTLVNKRFGVKTSTSTIHHWLDQFRKLCPISAIRKKVMDGFEDLLATNTFTHQDLEYKFMCHLGKLDRLEDRFSSLVDYVLRFKESCPDEFFHTSDRCSQPLFEVKAQLKESRNLLCEAAEFAVKAARNNYQRHEMVEKFLLVNDTATIACEVPVWYWEKSVDRGVTGHIDILQVRNGKVYIVDYKPKASKEKKAPRQLYHYASALSFRANVPFKDIVCTYFDRDRCYEYVPSEAEATLIRRKE